MNKIHFRISFFLIQFLFFSNIFAQTTIKTLFLGNSYTAYNNLPQLVHDVALSVGDTLIFDSNTPGGTPLRFHTWNAISQAKLAANNWNYVVLQGQSQEAITGNSNFNLGGLELNSQISRNITCATPMLYMTWGRENGDASNCLSYPVMCTYEGMDSTIRNKYLELANRIDAEVSPVSVLWKYLRQNHSNIQLYSSDGSHPSSAGSYAAACCFYASLFKKDPTLISYNFNLTPTDAAIIRNAVKLEVFNKLSSWDYKQAPNAEFSFKVDSGLNTIAFVAHDSADIYSWNFGDGTSSFLVNPVHSYLSNGTYQVQLTTTNCDQQTYLSNVSDTTIQFCNHSPTVGPLNAWICIDDTLWTEPAAAYQWLYQGTPIPETNQYLTDYRSYGIGPFSMISTINGCSELSQEYTTSNDLLYSSYSMYKTPYLANPCIGDTAYLVLYTSSFSNLTGPHLIQVYKDSLLFAQWSVDSIPITDPDSLIITEGGFYEFYITQPNSNCPQDSTYTYFDIDCIDLSTNNLLAAEKTGRIYPNPTTHTIWIELDEENSSVLEEIELYNAFGHLLKQLEISASRQQIDVSNLPSGVYFIRPKNPRYATLKLIKQ